MKFKKRKPIKEKFFNFKISSERKTALLIYNFLSKVFNSLKNLNRWTFVGIIILIFFGMFYGFFKISQKYPSTAIGNNMGNLIILILVAEVLAIIWKKYNDPEPLGIGGM